MSPHITVITPTIGRVSLRNVLDSAEQQSFTDFEYLVVSDGYNKAVQEEVAKRDSRFKFVCTPKTATWGHDQVNVGLMLAKGKVITLLDDDDLFVPGAFQTIYEHTKTLEIEKDIWGRTVRDTGKIYCFRAKDLHGNVYWINKNYQCGIISGQCIVLPNVPEKFGLWTPHYAGDWDFMESTLKRSGWELEWIDQIIIRMHAWEIPGKTAGVVSPGALL